jgi:hypothetical protein
MAGCGRAVPLVALLAAFALEAPAQQGASYYEQLYGPPIEVSIQDLVTGMGYEGRSIRTHGRLEFSLSQDSGVRGRSYSLRDGFGNTVQIAPLPDVEGRFNESAMHWLGRDVEVTGLFRRGTPQTGQMTQAQSSGQVNFWGYIGPPDEKTRVPEGKLLSLEALVTKPGNHDGQNVRVVGKFRGRNLYGDLPSRSERNTADWVIKDDLYAAWVTGRKPKGDGFDLDTGLRRDTGRWLEVAGRVESAGGVVYIRAQRVALTRPPTETAEVKPPSPPPERPKQPPVVVFALPLDGEPDVPPDSRFMVQFSKDMDEESFRGRVLLRYAGGLRPGDRPFDGLRLGYDGGRRTLIVDPGDALRTGRQVELLLLEGIKDVEGLALAPRRGEGPGGVVDVLSWRVGG